MTNEQRQNELRQITYEILRGTVLADTEKLGSAKNAALQNLHKLAREAQPPKDPFEDPKIAFGYALALGELTAYAERLVVPKEKLAYLIGNPTAFKALSVLTNIPTGVMKQKDFWPQFSPTFKQAEPTIITLEQENLLRQENRGKYRVKVVALTALGRGSVQFLNNIGYQPQI